MKRLSKNAFSKYIETADFRGLFNDLGWDNDSGASPIAVDNTSYSLQHIAHKSGFKILHCHSTVIPDYATRRKIDTQAGRLYQDHLIIFSNAEKNKQTWLFILREAGKPARTTETHWHIGQSPELLFQRASGLFFHLDEEDHITILDVKGRVNVHFAANAEKITKKFYDQFRKEHHAFMAFIKGIAGQGDREWYASLMLNRLMFCYFIQKKDFLDRNRNYLRDKLNQTQEKKGKNQFYSFYRDFLLALFHKGLGRKDRPADFDREFGLIPYLNGGLFDEHELEIKYGDIQVPDEAFEVLFNFFDQYEWHLDNKPSATGKDINPDVIGYIFEKYINDRAQMGAYYTKEDITEYISKNCVLPFLFEETHRRSGKNVFAPGKPADLLLRHSGDRYIYESVRKGVDLPLPPEIEQGIDTTLPQLIERRKQWNKPTDEPYALPTEIWRETVERRQRCERLRAAIAGRDIKTIHDFITFNIDIRQFAQDILEDTTDPDWLRHFFNALREIAILDPTCGSGAFLFAALNILEPLYEACLLRIRSFVEEAPKGKFREFEKILEELDRPEHPNASYFIHKSIILHNLYGVDIMREAVEIAKLRLFLRLAATVDADYAKPNLGLEPLPDVDFNIRAGNTLVGYATLGEAMDNIRQKEGMFAEEKLGDIRLAAEKVSMAFTRFRDTQLIHDAGSDDFYQAKQLLNRELAHLNEQLNRYLALSYLPDNYSEKQYQDWLNSHQPFHWCTEFYRIIEDNKGFDAVIGNPPYVEYSKVRTTYAIKNYSAENCGNLFAMVSERAYYLSKQESLFSFIVPISFSCTQRMENIQNLLYSNSSNLYLSHYAERPSKLFSGAEVLLTIFVVQRRGNGSIFSTGFLKWASIERDFLFNKISYHKVDSKTKKYVFGKTNNHIESKIFTKIKTNNELKKYLIKLSEHKVYYRIGGGRYWKVFTDFQPKFILNGKNSVSSRENHLFLQDEGPLSMSICMLSSSLFYWYFIMTTNCRDLNPSDLFEFPFNLSSVSTINVSLFKELKVKLMESYKECSIMKEKTSKLTGDIVYQEFYPRLSKPIIDQIDAVLASHYGFTEEELDYIINYDIKYRMGGAEEEGD